MNATDIKKTEDWVSFNIACKMLEEICIKNKGNISSYIESEENLCSIRFSISKRIKNFTSHKEIKSALKILKKKSP